VIAIGLADEYLTVISLSLRLSYNWDDETFIYYMLDNPVAFNPQANYTDWRLPLVGEF
jgi:hypothetical protein